MTAVAGNGYWIDTTSNACTITLPSSASNGDEIIFADYDRTWGTNGITIDSNGLNYQGQDDTFDCRIWNRWSGPSYSLFWTQLRAGYQLLIRLLLMYQLKEMRNGIFGYGDAGSVSMN